jgi:hypothetical protein
MPGSFGPAAAGRPELYFEAFQHRRDPMAGGLAQIAAMELREIVDGSSTRMLPPLAELG